MKNSIILFVLMVFGLLNIPKLNAQFVSIPDTAFVNFLVDEGYGPAMNGNLLDTAHPLVVNATGMNCSGKSISELEGIQYFINLQELHCRNNLLTSLSNFPPNIHTLDCSENQISYLGPLPPTLGTLNCNFNALTMLPGLPSTLTYLSCNYNNLTSLTPLPANLWHLECGYNMINSLPPLPVNLDALACDGNNLTTLPALPTTLTSLNCGFNILTSLPVLPSALNLLWCNSNPLTSFPSSLPTGLIFLKCSQTQRTSLPSLPNSLEELFCDYNQLTTLPNLPAGMQNLFCAGNLITQLPALPSTLQMLDAGNNLLTDIPAIPLNISFVNISNNQLATLLDLPVKMGSLDVSGNTTLTCLPKLDTLAAIYFSNTGIQCLPNYGAVSFSNPAFGTIPLCDIFNVNGCDFYYNISGQVYADGNSNCINNFNEQLFSGIKINLYQGGNLLQQTYTSQSGLYSIDVSQGNYDYAPDTTGMPFEIDCPATGIHSSIITIADSIDTGMDFGIQCETGFDVGIHAIFSSGNFFPADSTIVTIKAGDLASIYNLSCANGVSGTLTVYFAGPVQFAGSLPGSLTPVATSNSLTYTIANFGNINMNTAFQFYMITDTSAQFGQQICFVADITPLAGDNNNSNNQLTHCFNVVNSFDPNDKQVSPVNEIEQGQEWLTYTIRFQNTGTAPAQHIVITDTLDANVQESSFTYLGSGHNAFINVTGNLVNFTFPNINLPDSLSDEPNSHGYVQYKVKVDAGLPIGTTIENTANIYFDFNPPVITNTTMNTIIAPTGIEETLQSGFAVYPNPAINILNISSVEPGQHKVTISDFTGRIVYRKNFYGKIHEINVSELAGGIYFVQMENEFRNETSKIIVK